MTRSAESPLTAAVKNVGNGAVLGPRIYTKVDLAGSKPKSTSRMASNRPQPWITHLANEHLWILATSGLSFAGGIDGRRRCLFLFTDSSRSVVVEAGDGDPSV